MYNYSLIIKWELILGKKKTSINLFIFGNSFVFIFNGCMSNIRSKHKVNENLVDYTMKISMMERQHPINNKYYIEIKNI